MREKMRIIQLTTYARPKEKISSQYGMITMEEWLIREGLRIMSDPNRFAEIRQRNGYAALFVNKVA